MFLRNLIYICSLYLIVAGCSLQDDEEIHIPLKVYSVGTNDVVKDYFQEFSAQTNNPIALPFPHPTEVGLEEHKVIEKMAVSNNGRVNAFLVASQSEQLSHRNVWWKKENGELRRLSSLKPIRVQLMSIVRAGDDEGLLLYGVLPPKSKPHLYFCELETGNVTEIGSDWPSISPDAKKALLYRMSSNGKIGFKIIYFNTFRVEQLLTGWSASPESGSNWDWKWASDSTAIHFKGASAGLGRRHKKQLTRFDLVYCLQDAKFYGENEFIVQPRKVTKINPE